MTKKIILIFMAALCSVGSYSQTYRSCATTEVHEEQLRKNPEIKQKLQSIENHFQFYEQSGGSMRSMAITIPVVVHVVYNTASQNISDAQIQSQIDVLNEDFRKLNSDVSLVPSVWQGITADTQIEFCLAKRDPMGNATTGITRTYTSQTSFSTNNAMKYASSRGKDAWNRNQYMNIWVCNLGGSLAGYAQFPGGTAATDGIVVHYSTFGRTGTLQNGYNKGRVTTHEVGHWLNLRHIWGDASCGNDYVTDTPTQSTANYGCPGFPYVTCSNGPNGDMYMNYMDYTFDACKYMFTNGQASRMNAVLASGGFRNSLTTSQGCVPPGSSTTCNTPTGLTASVGTTSASLNWASTGAMSYTVKYKQLSSASWITINSTQISTSLSGLTSGVTYEFQVQSNCSSSSSSFSSSATFTTSASVCNVPTGLVATVATTSATLSWTGTGAVSYTVRYKQLSSSSWLTINSTQTSASISGLTSGVIYEFQVQSNCSSSSSLFSNSATFTTNIVVCNIPTGLSVINISTSFVTVSWTSNGSLSYVIRYKPVSSITWNSTTTTLTSLSIGGLTAGVNYEVQVQGVCSSSSSAFSSAVNFTIPIVCNIPSGLIISNISTSSATFSWNSTSAVSYNVKYKPTTSSSWTSLNTSQISVYISGLSSGTAYEIQVQSVCSSVLSAYSESVTFTTSAITCNIPTGLFASNITMTTATASWSNSGAVSYFVRYKSISSNSWSYISSSQTSVSIGGLTSGVSYEFQVQSVCGTVSSAYSGSVVFTTLLPDCISPSGLAVSNVTTTSAQLSWSNSGADSYNVRYKLTSSTNWNNLNISQTSGSLSGLVSGSNYEFQVQGVCIFKISNYSNSFNFATTAVCNIPGNITVSNITTSSALLSWSNTGAISYNIRYKATSTSGWMNISTSQTSISISGLASGVYYEFQVQSICGANNSFFSESAIFVTTVITCVIPSGLSANNITSSTVTLQWNSTGVSSYNVRYKELSSITWSILNSSQTMVNIGGLQAGTGYEFQVQGSCGTIWSAYSTSTSFVTASPLCELPGGLTVSSLTTNSVVLSWNSTGATSYVLRYKAVTATNWISFNSLQTSVFLSGLTGGANYEFQVQSKCGSNFSAFSASNVFSTVVATTVCEIPDNLSVSAITNTTANLSWNGPGATSYNLRYKNVSSLVWSNVNTSGTSISVGGLQEGTAYEFQVQSVCGSTFSSYSASNSFTTTAPFCVTPTGLFAGSITNTTVNLSWSSTGATTYTIRFKSLSSFIWNYTQTSLTSVNLGGLQQGTEYEFQVQGVCGNTSSSYSASFIFKTLAPACSQPSGLSATNISATIVTLSWTSTGSGSYNVRYKPIISISWSNLVTNQTFVNLAGLADNITYEFQVQSNCSGTLSPFSVSEKFTTLSLANNTITVGTGTLVNNLPYGTGFFDERVQFFITKAELDAAGYNAINNRLTSLAFYVTNASSQIINNFRINIAHVSTGSFGNNYFVNTSNSTTVFSENFIASSNGWNTHTFNNPFIYNGINNLLIEICFDNNSSSFNSMVQYTVTTQPTVLFSQDNLLNDGICFSNLGTLSNNRPNMRFGFNGSNGKFAPPPVIEEQEISSVTVYPNPATTETSVSFKLYLNDTGVIEIIDLSGKVVCSESFQGKTGENELNIQLNTISDLVSGMYFIKIRTSNEEKVAKLIKR